MKLGVSSPTFSLRDFEEVLSEVSEHFGLWEIVAEGRHHLPSLGKKLELLSSYKIKASMHSPMSDVNIGSVSERMREASIKELCEAFRVASKYGISLATVHPGYTSPLGQFCKDRILDYSRASVPLLERVAEEYGMTLAFENMPYGGVFENIDDLLYIIEGRGKRARLCFDIGHANIAHAIEGFLGHIDLVENVHMHDNHGGPVDEHLPVGTGATPNEYYRRLLKDYDKNIIFEVRKLEDGIANKLKVEKMINEARNKKE